MEPSKLKLLTVLSQDTTDNINKEKKHPQILLPVFLLGQEVFYTEPNSITSHNLKHSVTLYKLQPFKLFKMDR